MTRKSIAGISARKLLISLAVVGVAGGVAGLGAYSAFTATTTNSGNSLSSGTVEIGQHSGATAFYNATAQGPGAQPAKCVRVSYTGSITAAAVKLYGTTVTNGSNYNLKVERGSGITSPAANMNCTGFSASGTIFDAALSTFPTTSGAGLDGKASAGTWATNDAVDYRFTITVNDDSTPNAHTSANSTGSHSFIWEATS